MEKTYEDDNDEIVIDLREVFYAVRRHFFAILAAGLFLGCVVGAYTILFRDAIYTSSSSLLVLSKETTLTSIADIQLGSQLTKDYQVLIVSTPVLDQVISHLDLDTTAEDLRETITVNNPNDTRILEISVENTDPIMAKTIVDELSEVASVFIGDKMEVVPPKIIETGKIATEKTSPSVGKNVLIGILAGFVLAGGIVVTLVVMDDTIKSEDDIAKYLGMSTLASVPDRKDFIGSKNKRSKKRSRKSGGK